MKAYLSKRAARAAERIDAHWRKHGDDPTLFAREFLDAIVQLESSKLPGSPYPTARRPTLKRLLLRKSRCHLYFEVDDANQVIRILHIWDGRREHAPNL